MGKKRAEWILAAALLLAVNVLMLPSRAVERLEWGEFVIRGVETAVFLSMLAMAVRGVKGMDWRIWLGTAALSAVGMPLELLAWHFWSGFIPAGFLRSATASAIITTGELMTCFLIMAAMSLFLHRRYLRNRRTGRRTFGRMELWLCPVLMIAILTAAVLAQWYQVVYYYKIQQQFMEQLQGGDPLAVLGAMLGASSSPGAAWADQVYRACRLLLKALCIWIMACGVLGFAEMAEQKQGDLYDH